MNKILTTLLVLLMFQFLFSLLIFDLNLLKLTVAAFSVGSLALYLTKENA